MSAKILNISKISPGAGDNYSLGQNCWDTFVSPCPFKVW